MIRKQLMLWISMWAIAIGVSSFATRAFAAASNNVPVSTPFETTAGIVTPDIATGFTLAGPTAITKNNDMVVCPASARYENYGNLCYNSQDSIKRSQWKYPKDLVPKGKQYVGFKPVRGYAGTIETEIYWK